MSGKPGSVRGALIAMGVALPAALIAWLRPDLTASLRRPGYGLLDGPVLPIAILGTATVMGALFAHAASLGTNRRVSLRLVAGMSLVTVATGSYAIAVTFAGPVGGLLYGALGIVAIGVPMLVIVLPHACVWACTVRWCSGDGGRHDGPAQR